MICYHPLRLESELLDLRVGYANPYSNTLRLSVFDVGTGQQDKTGHQMEKAKPEGIEPSGFGTGRRLACEVSTGDGEAIVRTQRKAPVALCAG